VLTTALAAPFAATAPPIAVAAPADALSTAWTATQGFDDSSFIQFNADAYKSMVEDERRTPMFEKAIRQRLAGTSDQVVVDLGTGPFAVLAIIAARAGAKKVYAIEASPKAAKLAREAVRQAKDIPAGVIDVVEGFSTSVTLPEKCDLCVAEIVGSIASEEGLHATIRDAQARLMKRPYDAASYIPTRCQTLAAPASYALHYALGPPQFDWAKLKGEPVRLNCRDESLQLLSEPQLLEDVGFAEERFPAPGEWTPAPALSFAISKDRVEASEAIYYEELKREGAKEAEAKAVAAGAAYALSGVACWPRLVLDPQGTLVVDSRGPRGEHQKSHWQTVLPLLSARPVTVKPGEVVEIEAKVTLGKAVDVPPSYRLRGRVLAA
jgi:SAM-dependent methyltransferase